LQCTAAVAGIPKNIKAARRKRYNEPGL